MMISATCYVLYESFSALKAGNDKVQTWQRFPGGQQSVSWWKTKPHGTPSVNRHHLLYVINVFQWQYRHAETQRRL